MNLVELPKLYTQAELAEYLRCDDETIARERRRGRLKFTTVGKKIRFTAEHIQEYLRSRECTATSEKEKTVRTGTSTSTTSEISNASAIQLAREIAPKRKNG